MPSKSAKQARTMAAAAHDPAFAAKVGISQSVAKDFNTADAGTNIRSQLPRMEEDKAARRGKAEKAMYGPSRDSRRSETPVGRKGLLGR